MKKSTLITFVLVVAVILNMATFQRNSYPNELSKKSDLRMNVEDITLVTPENKTYTEPMSGYYPGTYGFESDDDGTVPAGWEYRLTTPQADSYINVISSLDGHNKVLDLNKGNTYGSHLTMGQNFSAQEYGTIEFWLRTTDVTEKTEIILRSENSSHGAISISQGAGSAFTIYALGGWQSLSHPATNNKWYHIKFQFECGTGNHYSLDQYYFRVFIDGLEFGDYSFASNAFYLDTFAITQTWDTDNYHSYFDAIGYSWNSNYNIGDNLDEGLLLSYQNSTSLEWQGYSLDGQVNGTIYGNTTIPIPNDGLHTIQVFGNDSMGTIFESELINFEVDVNSPLISINSPTTSQIFSSTTPDFDISITELNLDSTWYTLDNGLTNITFTGLTGTISQTEWDKLSTEPVTIRFYANDTYGREGNSEVVVNKDVSAPMITINSPTANQYFGKDAPNFDLSISESNLNTTWYTLDSGVTNITFSGLTGNIDQSEWDKFSEIPITIRFYANDTFGYENYTEIIVNKETTLPVITIISPIGDDYYSEIAPSFEILIVEPNLETTWYTIDNGVTNITFSGLTGNIDQSEWDKILDGLVTIEFYAKDNASNENYAKINIYKDTLDPIVTILSPTYSEIFGELPPEFNITIDELNFDNMWYTIDNGLNNYSISQTTGHIDLIAWENAPYGTIVIKFYAEDKAGNIGYLDQIVLKRSPSVPPGIPGYDLVILISVLSIISGLIIRRRQCK